MTTSPSNDAGFTLVELLIAILIMTVGLLGLLQALIVDLEHNTRNAIRDEAMRIAEEQMNILAVYTSGTINSTGAAIFRSSSSAYTGFTLTRRIRGGDRNFAVSADWRRLGAGNSRKVGVHVRWSFKGREATQDVYSITRNRN